MAKKIPPTDQLFAAGTSGRLMGGEYTGRLDILNAIQRRHEKGMSRIDKNGYWVEGEHRWKVPYGVRAAFTEKLLHGHMMHKFPFHVQWQHPDGDSTKTLQKSCMSLGAACSFIATRVQYVDPDAFVVCRLGFYIPRPLMGKFPRPIGEKQKKHYWCPRCMQPRRFRRVGEATFFATKKFWNEEKARYDFKNVKLALIECTSCGITNRDGKFRASNQPLEVRRIKKGKTRVRRRK